LTFYTTSACLAQTFHDERGLSAPVSGLRETWQLCRRWLIVATQVQVAGRGTTQVAFGDGILTRRGTFQKFYEQGELRTFLET
jgi:hypothetical protein